MSLTEEETALSKLIQNARCKSSEGKVRNKNYSK